ncbi:MAG: transaldolase family protein, partial [Actinomycetota bacterium]
VNVNITLLFTVQSYEKVARAYIRGLQRRRDRGEPIDGISSVASFFDSRVDTVVDGLLPADSPLRGKVAIANAKIAYQRFLDIFSGPAWEKLAAAGAQVQRPLWASTGTKNPAYPDTLYVDGLIGPDTVNTLPETTIRAFEDHGRVERTIDLGAGESAEVMRRLETVGIDMEAVGRDLEEAGVASFRDALAHVLRTLASKEHALLAR